MVHGSPNIVLTEKEEGIFFHMASSIHSIKKVSTFKQQTIIPSPLLVSYNPVPVSQIHFTISALDK